MAVVVLLFAVLVATAWLLDARQKSQTDGFAVIELIVVVTLAALALGAVILAVGAVRSA